MSLISLKGNLKMKTPTFFVKATYASKTSADADALKQGLNPDDCVFHCEGGMFGYEIRIYDDWKQWQPNLYLSGVTL
jgi:hypothetical protein